MTLLRSNSGFANPNTAATTYDSVAISGLTASDELIITFITYNTSGVNGYSWSVGDGTNAFGGVSVNSNAGQTQYARVRLTQYPNLTTSLRYGSVQFSPTSAFTGASNHVGWTGSWTLYLKTDSSGDAGATVYWRWNVYKLAGQ